MCGVRIAALAGALCIAVAGCGSEEPPETPAACLGPASAYVRALEAAPAEVRLDGGTPISACLVEEQATGALQTVGASLVATATALNERARTGDRRATVALGYLIGAVQEAAAGTGGIHEDLTLRLDSAARYRGPSGDPLGAGFERAFGEGYGAGQESG